MKQFFTLTIAFLSAVAFATAQESWPRTVNGSDGSKITIYEPQPEFISGDQFTGRAAVSVRKSANDEPVFGAMLFTATLKDEKSSKDIQIESLSVTKMKLSGEDDDDALNGLSKTLENDAQRWNWGMTVEELKKTVEEEQQTTGGDGFNNAAPKIIYRDKPSTLVVLDGDPRVLYDKDLATDKVVNSPNIIFKEKGKWNLYAGGKWYASEKVTTGWKPNKDISAKVKSVETEIRKQEKESNGDKAVVSDPKVTDIIVSTVPAELIQTEGEPVYKNVAGTSLLYVSNSPNEIFKDINNQKTYILIAGRWYQSNNLNGPWSYIAADKLPADFARIPEGSEKDAVLANVAGTDAAETAILEAAMPQTAKVDRKTATINVEYDGAPQFSRIKGTSLSLAENSNVTVMRDADGYYFALDNGIWFISDDAYGPWSVANDRPKDVDDIPASSPAYHSRYAYVYDAAPDYVYMGYTPGYLGSYVYGPTVVYGTGYHYRPWFRTAYYPRPITWGFGFMYDPWYGWNFNFGYNYGYMYVGFNYGNPYHYGYGGGWFGPQRYCPYYRRPYWNDGYYGRGNYYGRRNDDYGRRNEMYGARPDRRYAGASQNGNGRLYGRTGNNLYNDQRGVTTRTVSRSPRVYRPGATTNETNNLTRVRRQAADGGRPTLQPSRGMTEGRTQSGVQRPDVNRREMPTLTNPRSSEDGQSSPRGSLRDNDGRPRLENNAGENRNENLSPRRVERPAFENRQTTPVETPSAENRQPVRTERPTLDRQNSSSQPRVIHERQNSVPAPRVNNERQSTAPRVNYERQNSAPAPRPTIERSAPAPRPSSGSQGGSPRSGNAESRRPDRR